MSVRARFYVRNVNLQAGDTALAALAAVSRGRENSEWSKFTPGGELTLQLSREASGAKKFFLDHIGREVYLDISVADNPLCTQCGEPVVGGQMGVSTPDAEYGQGISHPDGGYVPDEFVHVSCVAAAKQRLGL